MTPAEVSSFGWDVAAPLLRFLLTVAVALLGMALLKLISS